MLMFQQLKIKHLKVLVCLPLLYGCGATLYHLTFCGCGVAHMEAHTTPVQEDLGSILHLNPGWHFSEALISLLSHNRLKNDVIL